MNDDHLLSKNTSSSGQPVETVSGSGQFEDRNTEYKLLLNLSDAYIKQGQWVPAVGALESARLIALALGDKSHQASVLIRLGDINLALQKNDEAIKHYTDAASIFCEMGNKHGEAKTLVTIGYVHYRSANWCDAGQLFNRRPAFLRTDAYLNQQCLLRNRSSGRIAEELRTRFAILPRNGGFSKCGRHARPVSRSSQTPGHGTTAR